MGPRASTTIGAFASPIVRLYERAGRSYREMARLLKLDDAGYRKHLNFLNHHDLTVKR